MTGGVGVDCWDCKNCEVIDEIFYIFNCKAYRKVWSGGACVDCEYYEPKEEPEDNQ